MLERNIKYLNNVDSLGVRIYNSKLNTGTIILNQKQTIKTLHPFIKLVNLVYFYPVK